jgi:3'-phosphoadenosine 5'-phosphosulfate sulfotransferase (PAPS reductase)/FAD synthetase
MPKTHSTTMRHIVALSGGKDSTALAIFLRQKYPGIAYEFCFADTGREFPEVYTFLDQLEGILEQEIIRLTDYGRTFDFYLEHWNYFLPGKASRWCTERLKLRPFHRFCKETLPCTVYIGLRADEPSRVGNYGLYTGISYSYPFRDHGIGINEVLNLLNNAQITLPDFYRWRSTGGCYMCPWQRSSEWIGLYKNHPDLFAMAANEEEKAKQSSKDGYGTTWSIHRTPLNKLVDDYERQGRLFDDEEEIQLDSRPCLICAK